MVTRNVISENYSSVCTDSNYIRRVILDNFIELEGDEQKVVKTIMDVLISLTEDPSSNLYGFDTQDLGCMMDTIITVVREG